MILARPHLSRLWRVPDATRTLASASLSHKRSSRKASKARSTHANRVAASADVVPRAQAKTKASKSLARNSIDLAISSEGYIPRFYGGTNDQSSRRGKGKKQAVTAGPTDHVRSQRKHELAEAAAKRAAEQAAAADKSNKRKQAQNDAHYKLSTASSTGSSPVSYDTSGDEPNSELHGRSAARQTVLLDKDEAAKKITVLLDNPNSGASVGVLDSEKIVVKPIAPLREMHVAKLAHGLDRVLFNPGVHWLRDQRTGIYNYDPRLRQVLDVDLFDYNALPPYQPPSHDKELIAISKLHNARYCGSTSSMTSLLSHCYFLISNWREPSAYGFSESFKGLSTSFSEGSKLPASITLHNKGDGLYAIDTDKSSIMGENSNYVLTSLGKSLEKVLTTSPEKYSLYERLNSWQLNDEERNEPEAYHYAMTNNFMMRSQLDCEDPRLPNKTFDLKTRAVVSVRMDRANYVESAGYQIERSVGRWYSFEREYHDMVRAAFLKYNFQVRIGHMDGIFVAYHNTDKIFGFQYVSLEEMDMRLFGSRAMGDKVFRLCVRLLERLLDVATQAFPDESLSISLETRQGAETMNMFVNPYGDESRMLEFAVTADRFFDDKLVQGPTCFSALRANLSSEEWEDELYGPYPSILNQVSFRINYNIEPRRQSTERTQRNLGLLRERQNILGYMTVPNVEMLNEREQHRVDVLKKSPEALRRFVQEREDGTAPGMPLAPGQLSAREVVQRHANIELPETPQKEPPQVPWQRIPNPATVRLRELSREGSRRAAKQEHHDQHKVYKER